MPFALVVIGLLMIITGFQNTYSQFGKRVASDFTGPGNFIYWIVALGLVGSIGYIKDLEKFSRAFMALIIVGMFLTSKNQGTAQGITFFSNFTSGLQTGTTGSGIPTAQSASDSGGNGINSLLSDAGTVASIASLF